MNAPESTISRRSNLDSELVGRTSPLPISWYFDSAWFEREMLLLFEKGPGYVGHELMAPNTGDYSHAAVDRTRQGAGARRARRQPAVEYLPAPTGAAARRPRQCARTSSARCTAGPTTWKARLLGAPDFDPTPNCALPKTRLRNWHGLLFAGERDPAADLADFPLAADYDFSGYVFDKAIVDECPFNWKNFLEIFLELYHVEAMHPGLQRWVDSANYEWGFGSRWSYQILGVKDGLRSQISPNYARYRDAVLAYSGGKLPKYGTVWSILYPNVMIEWYPYALVISTLIPRTPEHTSNIVEFYYPEEVQAFERQIVEAHQAAYAESAVEDADACTRLQRGRKALWLANEDDTGPFHSPHEDGMIHMHDWIRRQMGQRRTL